MKQTNKAQQCGFTMLELLFVMVIALTFFLVAVSQFRSAKLQKNITQVDQSVRQLMASMDIYFRQECRRKPWAVRFLSPQALVNYRALQDVSLVPNPFGQAFKARYRLSSKTSTRVQNGLTIKLQPVEFVVQANFDKLNKAQLTNFARQWGAEIVSGDRLEWTRQPRQLKADIGSELWLLETELPRFAKLLYPDKSIKPCALVKQDL